MPNIKKSKLPSLDNWSGETTKRMRPKLRGLASYKTSEARALMTGAIEDLFTEISALKTTISWHWEEHSKLVEERKGLEGRIEKLEALLAQHGIEVPE